MKTEEMIAFKQKYGFKPEIMIIAKDTTDAGPVKNKTEYKEAIKSGLAKVNWYNNLQLIKGHRPALIIITRDAQRLTNFPNIIGYLPGFCRGSTPFPVRILDSQYNIEAELNTITVIEYFKHE